MSKQEISLFWFRRDLRLNDNVGLYYALQSGSPVLPIFIFDSEILGKLEDKSDKRVHFIHESIQYLSSELRKIGSDIETLYGEPSKVISDILKRYKVKNVYCNEDYEPSAIVRDNRIKKILVTKGIGFYQYKDQCIFSKNDVLKKDNTPYTVYSPYKNKWLELLGSDDYSSVNCKKYFINFLSCSKKEVLSLKDIGFENPQDVSKISRVIRKSIIQNYDKTRDFPAKDGTSLLGIHLRFGTVSPRKCVQVALTSNQTWLEELIWREFFMQVLFHFPYVEKGPFKEKYAHIKWINNKIAFKKWCEGKTGYPIVDAGMRELNKTGHMHNRVRMVTASFLIKHLLIDWRWGEAYFAKKLMDFDLSANNGNWQWAAGCGCDAAPYFRVFNPYTQQKKFDPDFKYIKKWIPEWETADYPKEIVVHKIAYNRVKSVYKEALDKWC